MNIPTGAGRPLVLIHGWGMHGGVWSSVQHRLRFASMAVDLPGYGNSPSIMPYTLDGLVEAVLAQCPAQMDVCAWSLGGLVAQRMAHIAPERVRRMVLVGSTPCFTLRNDWACAMPVATFTQFSAELEQSYEVTLKRFLALQVRGDAAARETLAVLREQLFARGRPDAGVLHAGLQLLLHTDLRAQAGDLKQTTLLVQGQHDQLVPLGAAQWMAQALPDAHLHVIAGAAHAPFLSHTTEFVDVLHDFLGVS
uniref:Carboxylesterase BioH (Biotin synthesis protein BioH) n=1 Tax=mine drainage metagenome TaxID=410659 RepID=E6QRD8_9ZZZZ